LECFYLREYLRRDFNNNPIEMIKLQAFLKTFEGYDNVTINGVFDQATFDAVSSFQMRYFDDILKPWGHTAPTGYVYILTSKKINEIYCQRLFPINEAQAKEIVAFRALLESLRAQGFPVNVNPDGSVNIPGPGSTTTPDLPIVGQNTPPPSQGQNFNLAAAIFSGPATVKDAFKCLYEFLLILIVLYILGTVLEDVLYKDKDKDAFKRFVTKWTTISIGLALAIVAIYIWKHWCLILPLLIALIISLIWIATYSKHDRIKSSAKSWNLVLSARAKSMLKKDAPKSPESTTDASKR
jgi:hypothetical protein